MSDIEREIGTYQPISIGEVEAYSPEWRSAALEFAAADAYDITVELEKLSNDDPEFAELSMEDKGIMIGELEERLRWLADLLRKAKIVRHQNDESVSAIVDVHSDLLSQQP
jgi:hypothetical protein